MSTNYGSTVGTPQADSIRGGTLAMLKDGITNADQWNSNQQTQSGLAWCQFDFTDVYAIAQFRMWDDNTGWGAKRYNIEVSRYGYPNTFDVVYSSPSDRSTELDTGLITLSGGPYNCRFIRFRSTAGNGNPWFCREIQAWGADSQTGLSAPLNRAIAATVSVDSTSAGSSANVHDFSATTSWASNSDTTSGSAWVQYDLGSALVVHSFLLDDDAGAGAVANGAKRFSVASSNDGSTWTTRYASPSDRTTGGNTGIVVFSGGPFTARYWRFTCTSGITATRKWIVAEAQLWYDPSGGSPAAGRVFRLTGFVG